VQKPDRSIAPREHLKAFTEEKLVIIIIIIINAQIKVTLSQ